MMKNHSILLLTLKDSAYVGVIFLILLFSSQHSMGQINALLTHEYKGIEVQGFPYEKVDQYVLSLSGKSYENVAEAAKDVTSPFVEPHLKARAIYRWICDNITYDVDNFFQNKVRIQDNLPEAVLGRRKAVCIGYSNLFKEMYELTTDSAHVIHGYSQQFPSQIGVIPKDADHAWNAVLIYDHWYLIDATWGSGYVDYVDSVFVKEYNDFYFLTTPEYFIFQHLPVEKEWQLLPASIGMKEFKSKPIVESTFFTNVFTYNPRNHADKDATVTLLKQGNYSLVCDGNRKRVIPRKASANFHYISHNDVVRHNGVLKPYHGQHMRMHIYSERRISRVEVKINQEDRLLTLPVKQHGTDCFIDFTFSDLTIKYLTIMPEGRGAIIYKVEYH